MKKIPKIKFKKSSSEAESRIVKRAVAIKDSQPLIQSEQYQGPVRKHNPKAIKLVNHFAKQASADIRQSVPTFYHPDFEPSSLLLPKDRIEINSWCNYFYKYDALVSTSVDMHSELPLSKIRLDLPPTKDKVKANKILDHYMNMIGNTGIDLFNKLLMMGVEYYKLGNAFPWAQINSDGSAWERLVCLNPDYIHLEKLPITNALKIDLVADDRLRQIVHAGPNDEKTGKLYQTLPDDVIEKVMAGREIPLATDPNEGSHCAHIARKLADYHEWGSSLIERNFKTLVYKDRLRQSQDAIATRHLTPKHLVWAEYASKADVSEIREQVEDAMLNPDFAVITNYQLHWDLVGTSGGLMQLASEWQWITDDLLIGLMMNKNVLLGEGAFAGGQTVLEVLNQRYAIFREQLESYVEKNLFIPIARNNGFVEYEPGTLKKNKREIYLYPKVRWNRLNLTDDTQHKQMLAQAVAEGKVDTGTWLEYFGLNADTIAQRLKASEDTVMDPVYMELRRSIMMEVGRSLGPSVAKVYADAYGLELQDQGGGGFGMFGSSKPSITKFGKDFDIDYGENGTIVIKPKIERMEIDKVSETRAQREHERSVTKLVNDKEDTKEKLEVMPIDPEKKTLKPPREDMTKKVIKPDIFKMMKSVSNMFKGSEAELEDKSVEITTVPVSEQGETSYENMPFQSPEKTKQLLEEEKKLEQELSEWSNNLKTAGLDQYSRRLAKDSENEIVSAYYKMSNSIDKTDIIKSISKSIPQMYGAIYHTMVEPKEPIFKSSQTASTVFEKEIGDHIHKLTNKIELLASANRKMTEKMPKEAATMSSKSFKENESQVRTAIRSTVNDIITNIHSLC